MNLQGMTIIFAIIFLPIILISTYYIQLEVDTLRLQASYDTKLIDATTDAVSAFEINTANQDLSSVSDSLRSIIDASNNVFLTTLATNLGMSTATKTKVLPYIPAVVYTLYDGYYIYSPTQAPKVVTDSDGVYVKVGDNGITSTRESNIYTYNYTYNPDEENRIGYEDDNYGKILYYLPNEDGSPSDTKGSNIRCTTDPDKAYYNTNYMLKSFIPYSMSYTRTNRDDKDYNITVNYTLDNFITITGTIGDVYYAKSGYLINKEDISIPSGFENIAQDKVDEVVDKILENGGNIEVNGISSDDPSAESEDYTGSKTNDNVSAIKYYIKASIFSNWVYENLGDLNENKANENNSKFSEGFTIKQNNRKLNDKKQLFYEYSDLEIFAGDVENVESNFYEHKRKVIKNSIQYNLNLAMALYNAGRGDEYYQMPILSEDEWDKILSNVSVLSFMQGLQCGMKTYSNYAIVTSRNNELLANESDIYYVPINDVDTDGVKTSNDTGDVINTAHQIDCEELGSNKPKYYQSFPSREVKYDKVWDADQRKYVYDHVVKNCYYCIVNSNYDHQELTLDKQKAQTIAIAKIRNNTYKSCAFTNNYGLYFSEGLDLDAGRLANCYEIEITIKNAKTKAGNSTSGGSLKEIYLDAGSGNYDGDYYNYKTTYDISKDDEQVISFYNYEGISNYRYLYVDDGLLPDIVSVLYKYK